MVEDVGGDIRRSALWIVGALVVSGIAGILALQNSQSQLATKLDFVASEQEIVRETLRDISRQTIANASNRYTDSDAAKDLARIEIVLSEMRQEQSRHRAMISNNLANLARLGEREYEPYPREQNR